MNLGDMFGDVFESILAELEEEATALEDELNILEDDEREGERGSELESEQSYYRDEINALEDETEAYISDGEFLAQELYGLSADMRAGDADGAREHAQTLYDILDAVDSGTRELILDALDVYTDYTNRDAESEREETHDSEQAAHDDGDGDGDEYHAELSAFDLLAEVTDLLEWAQAGDMDAGMFSELSGGLYEQILKLSESDNLMASKLWDSLEDIENFLDGKTTGIGWHNELQAPVFSEKEFKESDEIKTAIFRGTYTNVHDAQAWVAEIKADYFVIVETETGFDIYELELS